MGNTCSGPAAGKSTTAGGFFQSVTAAVWRATTTKTTTSAAAAASDPSPPQSPQINRLPIAGLAVDSVLGRRTGSIKGTYSLGRRLGQGQFGTTFLAIERSTGLEFACKSIAKRKLTTSEDVEDVRREIQIMPHLAGNNNVIQIVDVFEDAIAVYVVMEKQ
ncbi:hypothetical protein Droror1_Dr00026044 [Drosera rotundifolia]